MAERVYRALYEKEPWHDGTGSVWAKEFSPKTPFHYDDGVTLSVHPTDLSPNATFLTERTA